MAICPIVDVHPSSYANELPIPLRELRISANSGHAVRLIDWAILVEMLAERYDYVGQDHVYPIDAYPDHFSWHVYDGTQWEPYNRNTMINMVNRRTHPRSTDADGVLRSRTFLDPSWDFAPEYSDNLYGRDLFMLHGLPLAQTPLDNRRIRRLDDLRRRYYDVKRCTRRTIPRAAISLTENYFTGFGYNNTAVVDEDTPRPYHWQDGSCGPVQVDLSYFIPPEITGAEHFAAIPRYILGYYDLWDEDTDLSRTRFEWCPIGTDGHVSLPTWSTCKSVYDSEIGGPHGDKDSWARFWLYEENGTRGNYVVVYDFVYPYDGLLIPWQWKPEGDNNDQT